MHVRNEAQSLRRKLAEANASGETMKYNLMRGDDLISTIVAVSVSQALAELDDERSQPRGTAKARGIKAIPVGREPLRQSDVDMLRTVVAHVEKGLLGTEREAIDRIMAFLERPTPRDIDAIVSEKNLRPEETHAVERTVKALWGAK
jgi:hypothetical protein